MTPLTSVQQLFEVLAKGARVYDEPEIDVLTHSLQTAEILESGHPDDRSLICAGLVHDIADALEGSDHENHERVGASMVRGLLGVRVASLVEGHVAAKRYLATVDPEYGMSERSTSTLSLQGGVMSPQEIAEFEARPEFESLLSLRRADDMAKDPGRPVRPLETWRALVASIAGHS